MSGENLVDVDTAALEAEADAALAQDPAAIEQVAQLEEQGALAPAAVSWSPLVEGFGPMVRLMIIPQWELTDGEGAEFAASLTQCLDLLFPGGLEGKYAPFARLAAASIGIVGTRYVMNGGKLPPMGPKRVSVDDGKDAGTGETGQGAASAAA